MQPNPSNLARAFPTNRGSGSAMGACMVSVPMINKSPFLLDFNTSIFKKERIKLAGYDEYIDFRRRRHLNQGFKNLCSIEALKPWMDSGGEVKQHALDLFGSELLWKVFLLGGVLSFHAVIRFSQVQKEHRLMLRKPCLLSSFGPIPPTAIIPLATGNDLSKSFGWGGSFPFNWRTAIKRTLDRVTHTPTNRLDSWRLSILMPAGGKLDAPHSLKQTEEVVFDQDIETDGKLPEKVSYYQGVFYNYFSIGMDAQVAYGFHHLRNEKPYLAHDPISNKMIYSGYSCKQGWFFTPCTGAPGLRGLKNILRLHVKRLNSSEWELVPIPSRLE